MENKYVQLQIGASDGITIASFTDRRTGHDYVGEEASLFGFRVVRGDHAGYSGNSRDDLIIERSRTASNTLDVVAACVKIDARFTVRVYLAPDRPEVEFNLTVQNLSGRPLAMQLLGPGITGYRVPGEPIGMVPIELGTVGPLQTGRDFASTSHFVDADFSRTLNAFTVATVYDRGGHNGIYLSGAEPAGPITQTVALTDRTLACRQTLEVPVAGSTAITPVAIGIHHGDWRAAVDRHLQRNSRPQFRNTPSWLRETALYNFGGEGGGGIYQEEPTISLADCITSFRELPKILDDARSLSSTVLHLFDFWEGAVGAPHPAYWNKGDYLPRADLGGPAALIDGISAVHDAGGRVLLYLEPFIVYKWSDLGQRIGETWGMRDPRTGELTSPYPDNYTMVSWFRPWQDYLVRTAQRFIGEYGADGIFLDSWGWQWNWPCSNTASGTSGTSADWNRGVLEIIDLVRRAATAIKPDAVVLTESLTVSMAEHADAGLDASFAWNAATNGNRLAASPLRYAFPQMTIFSAGRNRNELNQVFAAGANLALSRRWLVDAEYVSQLVETRRRFKDALIYGSQTYQPATTSEEVFAFYYEGSRSHLVTAVNTADREFDGALHLRVDAPKRWIDVLTGDEFTAAPSMHLDIPEQGLRVLLAV